MIATERGRQPESELARRFRQHVLADVDYLKSRGYNPTRFLSMIAENGSVVTVAKMLFASPRLTSDGFERLRKMGELSRSIPPAAPPRRPLPARPKLRPMKKVLTCTLDTQEI
jgi:hypothetical protein